MGAEGADARLPVPATPFGPFQVFGFRVHELVLKGHSWDALAAADAFECVARLAGDDSTVWFVAQGRMYALQALGRYAEALVIGEWLVHRHRTAGATVSEAKTLADNAETLGRLGRFDESLHSLARATALLERAPTTDVRYTSALSSVGEAARAAELYELAAEAASRATALAARQGHHEAFELHHAELLIEWGLRLEQLGRTEEAGTRYTHGAALARGWVDRLARRGPEAESPWAKALLALALGKLGVTDEALELAAGLVVPTREHDQHQEARLAHLAYGVALRAKGDLRAARREFVAAEELSAQAGQTTQRLIFQYELAVLAAQECPTEVAHDLVAALRGQAQLLWRLRLERMSMLRQARRRIELEAARARADAEALQDPLTGLGNRRAFDLQLAAVDADGAGPLVLVLIDVDRFKNINDVYSHTVGDAVLREVGSVLRAHCRQGDLSVRFGGDEFAVFVHADLSSAARVGERIRRALLARNWPEIAPGLRVTVSIGAAAHREGMTARQLFDLADRHLYAAKHRGRDQWAA
jgi:diguanylate cyclase (GGDEF)-like protein